VRSLSHRLIIAVALPLIIFFGASVAILDSNFKQLALRELQTSLETQLIALIAAVEVQTDGSIRVSDRNLEFKYAQIRRLDGTILWRSDAILSTRIDFGTTLKPAQQRLRGSAINGEPSVNISRGIAFELGPQSRPNILTFSIAATLDHYSDQLQKFRQRLLGWFLTLAVLLLITLFALLRWVLTPVRKLAQEIHTIETGEGEALSGEYPPELQGLTRNLNALLAAERRRMSRYRNTLGNLAHALKTPLTILQTQLHANPQIEQIVQIVDYQLKRAATSGSNAGNQTAVDIQTLLNDLRVSLLKVHAQKDFSIELKLAAEVRCVADRGDLLELCGNLIDNACKWCASLVRVTVTVDHQSFCLIVEDDGSGISKENHSRILERGVRADEHVQGHGIGLAVVREIVELYSGELTITAADLGGACFKVLLPQATKMGASADAR
jgi:two-component system, OmpR family, sensor histidine kinase PhoQ